MKQSLLSLLSQGDAMAGSLRSDREAPQPAATARPIPVLVLLADRATADRVRAALDGERFQLLSGGDATPLPPDVIVTDQSLASADLSPFHDELLRGQIAVIMVGRSLPADVQLPGDFTRRELRLASRLLAQIVALRRQQGRLAKLANTDPLTGLANRRALEELTDPAVTALALFDLDHFKRINAEFGYARGDEVLRGVAKTLAARGQEHFVARWGGDEFVLLWNAADAASACTFAENCRHALGVAASLKAMRPVSASAGVAFQESFPPVASLLDAAGLALRRAKQAGGKRTEI